MTRKITHWKGRPVSEMPREALIEAVSEIGGMFWEEHARSQRAWAVVLGEPWPDLDEEIDLIDPEKGS